MEYSPPANHRWWASPAGGRADCAVLPSAAGAATGGALRPGAASPAAAASTAADGSVMAASHLAAAGSQSSSGYSLQATGRPRTASQQRTAHHSSPPAQKHFFEFLGQQSSVKPMLRPRFPPSRKNQETADLQAARETAAAEARSQRFMAAAAARACHPQHSILQLGSPESAPPQAPVVPGDRGKRMAPGWCRARDSCLDPITSLSTARPGSAPGTCDSSSRGGGPLHSTFCVKAGSPSGSTASPAGTAQTQMPARPGSSHAARGRYNPLTHVWAEPPSPDLLQRTATTRGAISSSSSSSSVDGGRRRALSAPRSSNGRTGPGFLGAGNETVESLLQPGTTDVSSAQDSCRSRHAAPRFGTWGVFDPLRATWVVPPSDTRAASSEVGPSGLGVDRFAGSSHVVQVKQRAPPLHGEYNPITCTWRVPPVNAKSAATLDFAPCLLFAQNAFVRR